MRAFDIAKAPPAGPCSSPGDVRAVDRAVSRSRSDRAARSGLTTDGKMKLAHCLPIGLLGRREPSHGAKRALLTSIPALAHRRRRLRDLCPGSWLGVADDELRMHLSRGYSLAETRHDSPRGPEARATRSPRRTSPARTAAARSIRCFVSAGFPGRRCAARGAGSPPTSTRAGRSRSRARLDDVVVRAEAQLDLARARAVTRPSDVLWPVVSRGRERQCQRRAKRGEREERTVGAGPTSRSRSCREP